MNVRVVVNYITHMEEPLLEGRIFQLTSCHGDNGKRGNVSELVM